MEGGEGGGGYVAVEMGRCLMIMESFSDVGMWFRGF